MYKFFVCAVFVAASVPLMTSNAKAQRILAPSQGVCPASVDDMFDWTKTTEGFTAFAVPSDPYVSRCDDPDIRPVQAGIAHRAPSLEVAEAEAIAACETSRPADLGTCMIVGIAWSE